MQAAILHESSFSYDCIWIEYLHFSPLVNLLRQIIEVLETSSIAEERGKGAASKFWAAYKKISGEYDDNMLERCNGNMDIIMLFVRKYMVDFITT